MNYNSQLQSNNIDLQQVLETLQHKAAGGGQPSGVCPSLTISFDTGNIIGIYYWSNNQIEYLYSFELSSPIIIQNIDTNMPVIIYGASGAHELASSTYENLEILYENSAEIGIICRCTSTDAASLILVEQMWGG